ncbi:MAG: hypothetical protein CVU64_22430 [Deltaproteobacteria bacterium HGW-Deltaproteobacteria-21]|nr:MAG: hypothetical protein CVU64_22430 [Deltaproteobacteria bacterium HGW-Deltaproteobacteria-21]
MKKKTHEHCKVNIPERRYQPLRLAVAAVTLGMSIGISPIDVLASSKYSVSEEESPASVERPGAEFPKVRR